MIFKLKGNANNSKAWVLHQISFHFLKKAVLTDTMKDKQLEMFCLNLSKEGLGKMGL